MVSEKGTGCLIKQASGTLWYYYIDDQRLYYSKRLEIGWTSPVPLDMQPVKYYSATVLNDDRIMILAYLKSRELWLYELANGEWHKRSIYRISSGFENITFLKLIFSQGRLHMFYYVESSLPTAKDKLIHYVLEAGTWKRPEPLKFVSGAAFSPLDIKADNHGGLYLFYKRELHGKTVFYLSIFDEGSLTWSEKNMLFERPGRCRSFSCLPDNSGHIHIIWNEESLGKQVLYYKKIDKNDIRGRITEDVPIYFSTQDIEHPMLVSAHKPACFWMEGTKALYCLLQRNSSGVYEIKRVEREKVCPYIVITNDGKSNEPINMYGDGYPGFTWNVQSLTEMDHNYENSNLADADTENNAEAAAELVSPAAQEQYEEKSLAELESRLDNLYTALLQIKEYIRQKDMSLYQLSTQVKKLTFDIEQLRSKNALYKSRPFRRPKPAASSYSAGQAEVDVSIADTMERDASNEEAKDGKEEIMLGNVSIIINPEDETGDDKE